MFGYVLPLIIGIPLLLIYGLYLSIKTDLEIEQLTKKHQTNQQRSQPSAQNHPELPSQDDVAEVQRR